MNPKVMSIGILLILVLSAVMGFVMVPVRGVSTWYVDPLGTDDGSHGIGTGTSAFKTITYAIGSASNGDTIMVAAGTYNEEVDISKSLTIIGHGAATTTIDGAGVPLQATGLVAITAPGNVLFGGFTVKNANSSSKGNSGMNNRFEIFAKGAVPGVTYTISNCNLCGTNNASELEDYGFYNDGDSANVVFTHNMITQTGANAILVEVSTGATEISYNTLDVGCYGCDAIFFMTYGGVDVTTVQNVSDNTFDMGTGGPFDHDHRATGVSFCSVYPDLGSPPEASFTNMVISGNTFNNLRSYRRGIGFWNAGTGNDLVSPLVIDNIVNGVSGSTESSGIDFYSDGSGSVINARIVGNNITGTDTGIFLRLGDAPNATINFNNIAGNTKGLDWTGGSMADARFNWWGNESGPGPSGSGDPVTGNADISGYLHSPFAARVYTDPNPVLKISKEIGTDFTLDVKVEKIEDLCGFDINITWDNTLITFVSLDNSSLRSVWPLGFFEPLPVLGYETGSGYFRYAAAVEGPGNGFNGSGTLFELTFHVVGGSSLVLLQTLIHFQAVKLSNSAAISIPAEVDDGLYKVSSIRGDVNCDGKVDIFDLRTIAYYYDQSGPAKYDLNNDGIIDIFDLVIVASNYGYGWS